MEENVIGHKILKVIELQGRIRGLEGQLRETETTMSQNMRNIEGKGQEKVHFLNARDSAEEAFKTATDIELKALEAVKMAEKNLADASRIADAAAEQLEQYTNEKAGKYDLEIVALTETGNSIRGKKKSILEGIVTVKADLAAKQQELKADGYELNFGANVPKTTVM